MPDATSNNPAPPRAPRRQSVSLPPTHTTVPQSLTGSAAQLGVQTPPSSAPTRAAPLPEVQESTQPRMQYGMVSPQTETDVPLPADSDTYAQPARRRISSAGEHVLLWYPGRLPASPAPGNNVPTSPETSPDLSENVQLRARIEEEVRAQMQTYLRVLESRVAELERRSSASGPRNGNGTSSTGQAGPSTTRAAPVSIAEAPVWASSVNRRVVGAVSYSDVVQAMATMAFENPTGPAGSSTRVAVPATVAEALSHLDASQQSEWMSLQQAYDGTVPGPSPLLDALELMSSEQEQRYKATRMRQLRMQYGDTPRLQLEEVNEDVILEIELSRRTLFTLRRRRGEMQQGAAEMLERNGQQEQPTMQAHVQRYDDDAATRGRQPGPSRS